MEYQKIINFLDNTPSQPSKFKTKIWVDDLRGAYNTNNQIKFEASILKSSLCDYSDTYVLVKGTTSVAEVTPGRCNNDKEVAFKNLLFLLFA